MYEFDTANISTALMNRYGYVCDRRTYIIMERFLNPFMKRFDYKGLDDNFKNLYGNRNLWELFLFFAPAVAWFKDPVQGLMVLPVSGSWEFNAVGKPVKWRVFAINGKFDKELNETNSVLMFNDQAMSVPYLQLMYEAEYMIKLDKAMNQNIDLQSTPYIVEAYDESAKGAQSWLNLVKDFASRIVIRKKRGSKRGNIVEEFTPSQVLNTTVELKIKDMMTAENEFLFRGYTYLGIKNLNIEKSERLLTGEVSQNDIIIQNNFTNALKMRKDCFEQLNKMFGLSLDVVPCELETMEAAITSAYMAGNQNMQKENNNENDSTPEAK